MLKSNRLSPRHALEFSRAPSCLFSPHSAVLAQMLAPSAKLVPWRSKHEAGASPKSTLEALTTCRDRRIISSVAMYAQCDPRRSPENLILIDLLELAEGFEPPTLCLQIR